MKSQAVRVLDVLVLGPVLLWAAATVPRPGLRAAVVLIGLGTIAYNAANFSRRRRLL